MLLLGGGGGDGGGDAWRSFDSGRSWQLVNRTAPWSGRAEHATASFSVR